ncbi:MAG: Nif3-like dinuclear metal center hexameric protein, partial [Desulfovibrio sp.]|nr:Nif3-like dinuclear metal center hexameric protein [Desulfovibrio sp.]
MQSTDLIKLIEQTAPLKEAASWDKSGLQVTALRATCKHLAVCLDPSPTSVKAALKAQADFILSHHPLSLNPSLPKDRDDYFHVLRLLFLADVPLYAAHTSLDTNLRGPAAFLAKELNLEHCAALE